MTISVLGAGAFGTALAIALAREGRDVQLWGRNPDALAEMERTRVNPKLPDATLPDGLSIQPDLAIAAQSQTLLVAVPMQTVSGLLDNIDSPLAGQRVVACCKGIDLTTGTGPSQLIARQKPDAVPAVLTGPSFASDIAQGLPTALTLACADEALGEQLQNELACSVLRIYRSKDVIGAELGGALKNVVAVACGIVIGAQLGVSARAALMTRGFAEMQRVAERMGANPTTLVGLSGLGDLALTCCSDQSRNYRYGMALGAGTEFDKTTTVEGVATAKAMADIAQKEGLDLPICTTVNAICEGHITVPEALNQLLSRPLKEE